MAAPKPSPKPLPKPSPKPPPPPPPPEARAEPERGGWMRQDDGEDERRLTPLPSGPPHGASHAHHEAEVGTTGRRWANPPIGSFDNFWSAMRLLYIMSSGDAWYGPMFLMMGAGDAGTAPGRNDFAVDMLFPLAWMCIGFVFAINLFVGVVVDNFSRVQQEESGSAIMTREQQQWVSTVKAMAFHQPPKLVRPPEDYCRRAAHKLITTKWFDGFITLVVIVNIFVMACDYYGIEDSPVATYLLSRLTLCFNSIYYVEASLKIVGLGLDGYFGDGWCRFDFFLVCTSLLDTFAEELTSLLPVPPMMLRVLRIFRILRIMRLLKGAKGLRDLIITMVLSFPSLLNVGSLLALIIYMYSILGVQLFTFLAYGTPPGESVHDFSGITEKRNFESIGSSALTLFQCLTGDGWSEVMADAMLDASSGICTPEEGTCGSAIAIPYFISFQILGSFVFLNLVVAVILENFAQLHTVKPDLVSAGDLENFIEAWAEYDPDASRFIRYTDLPNLLLSVPKPLGLKGKTMRRAVRLCMRLDIPQSGTAGLVAYDDVVRELVENNYFRSGLDLDEQTFHELAVVPAPTSATLITESMHETVGMKFAYRVIGERLRGWVSRSRYRAEILHSYGMSNGVRGGGGGGGGSGDGGGGGGGSATGASGMLLSDVLGTGSPSRSAPRLPPSMDMAGGVTWFGWLRCNGDKRWVRVGKYHLELWLDNTQEVPLVTHSWARWQPSSIEIDYERDEPAMRLVLTSSINPDEADVVLGLQAYAKASEPTRGERAAHLAGFVQELRTHCGPRVDQVTREVQLADHQIRSRSSGGLLPAGDRRGATPSSKGAKGGRRGLFGTASSRKTTKSQRRAGSPQAQPASPGGPASPPGDLESGAQLRALGLQNGAGRSA